MNKKVIVPTTSRRLEWWGGLAFFIVFIAAHLVLGIKAAVKVIGVACIVTGGMWVVRRSVPVGIEARAPSFYLHGWTAKLGGIVMIAFGIALLLYSAQAAYLLGWAGEKDSP